MILCLRRFAIGNTPACAGKTLLVRKGSKIW